MEGTVMPPLDELVADRHAWPIVRDLIKMDVVPRPRLWELFEDHPEFGAWYDAEERAWRTQLEDERRRQIVAQRLWGSSLPSAAPSPSTVLPFRRRA